MAEAAPGAAFPTQAPGFALASPQGVYDLRAVLARGPAVLVFFPGAFAPLSRSLLAEHAAASAEYAAAGALLLGIGRDTVSALAAWARLARLPCPLLSDPDLAVSRAYGAAAAGDVLATETLFVLHPSGRVLFAGQGGPQALPAGRVLGVLGAR